MTSRLERLFILLESGSSNVTRKAAAKQIGEVQRLHPHELHNLLNRLIAYLHSNNWDTRIAASQAVQAILENVPQWNPKGALLKTEKNNEKSENSSRLTFETFDLAKVLEQGAHLMGSDGNEFDLQEENEGMNKKEIMIKQRQALSEKLGLNAASKLGISIEDIVTLDDMDVSCSTTSNTSENQGNSTMIAVQDIILNGTSSSTSTIMSNRERNRAKRKARQNQSQFNSASNSSTSPNLSRSNSTNDMTEPDRKRMKKTDTNGKYYTSSPDSVPDPTGSWGNATEWPLESFCSKLYLDLFSPRWEVRHGSATALRELLKSHIDGAGKSVYMTKDEMNSEHDAFLEDCALRLLCVLALDRFGDFISDQVVAPVRETCAQVLGAVMKQMTIEKVDCTINTLLKFIKQKDWEVRHGGLLGIKYMLVVREDLVQKFLPSIIGDVLKGLLDSVDDVGAVAASALIPIASYLPKLLTQKQVSCIVKMLWDLLLDQDELASACNSFMGLLAAILSLPDASNWIEMEPMSTLIPRLWPFLSHSTSSVRRSTLQTLLKLTDNSNNNVVNNIKVKPEALPSTSICSSQPCYVNPLLANGSNLVLNFGVKEWPSSLLQDSLRHIYQRVLVEHIEDIQNLVEQVWRNLVNNADISALLHAACPYVSCWMCLAMQPTRLAFDQNLIIYAKPPQNRDRKSRQFEIDSGTPIIQKFYLGGTETIPQETREKNVIRARVKACRMLGLLSKYLVIPAPGVIYAPQTESPVECYTKVLLGYLSSRSSLQRMISSLVITFWAENDLNIIPGPIQLQNKLKTSLAEQVYYDEVASLFTRLLQESRDFLASLKQYKVPINDFDNCSVLTLDQIRLLATTLTINLKEKYFIKGKTGDLLEERRKSLFSSYSTTNNEQTNLNICTQAALAGAVVRLHSLPEKLNPVVKPLMESVKREECEILQKLSAENLTHLIDQVVVRNPSPNGKIVNNLCTLLKGDEEFTPKVIFPDKSLKHFVASEANKQDPYHGIITLENQQRAKEGLNGSPVTSVSRGPGRPSALDMSIDDVNEVEDPSKKLNKIQRIGATFAIESICQHFEDQLPQKIPIIWELMFDKITKIDENYIQKLADEVISASDTNSFLLSLQLIEVAAPVLNKKLHADLFVLLPKLCILLKHPFSAVRHMASRCVATLAQIDPPRVMTVVINEVVPMLSMIENMVNREGSAEVIACIVNRLQFQIVPYVVLLVVPLLGRMSDPNVSVRLISTHCFATLIQLMPLDGLMPDIKTELTEDLKTRKLKDKEFLEYLFSPKTIPDFKVPVAINAELRSYQQAGVNWLWFLNKYKLHGILCDDMGLGKTLQTICILAGDHYQRQAEKQTCLPSLVICPPTLTGHWVYEVNKFLSEKFLKPLHYYGLPIERERLRDKVKGHNLVVASYDIVRKDVDFFKSIHWNYCVLDEGHIIKNGKTKSSKAIKQLIANHRLILSGTPIQNNVLELWSLFDFLMPGFLGTEKQFMVRFSRPILASRDPKSSLKEQEAGALAMEALHRQVLPFLLRRVKEDVLTDLPPKITQDLLCELSPLQERLYEDFSRTHFNNGIKECLESIDKDTMNKKTHVFQALRYLQNVCNHPKLVLKTTHPEYQNIITEMKRSNNTLDDIEHSAKLPALKQLLLDCGIGTNEEMMSINQHRALIFCQLKAMLDIIENDLLKKHLPAVTYLRLDGSVQSSQRHEIVTKFNNDPSIDVLLLTTQVGGLGLNLTGADTVIFVEHDWNPMKDLQAMDRAHRIGQKKVVNVYRLITRKSLEEKIMGLQKFKILTANTVVSVDNQTMETMGTDQLLDLFNLSEDEKAKQNQNKQAGGNSVKNVLENLPELWDNQQYEEEYDMSAFIGSLGKQK